MSVFVFVLVLEIIIKKMTDGLKKRKSSLFSCRLKRFGSQVRYCSFPDNIFVTGRFHYGFAWIRLEQIPNFPQVRLNYDIFFVFFLLENALSIYMILAIFCKQFLVAMNNISKPAHMYLPYLVKKGVI